MTLLGLVRSEIIRNHGVGGDSSCCYRSGCLRKVLSLSPGHHEHVGKIAVIRWWGAARRF